MELDFGAELGRHEVDPIPVVIKGGTSSDRQTIPELASWTGYNLVGTESPFQILPQDARRRKASIACQAGSGVYVLLGSQKQISNGTPNGFFLTACTDVTVESQAAVWCIPNGSPAVLSVLDQRFAK